MPSGLFFGGLAQGFGRGIDISRGLVDLFKQGQKQRQAEEDEQLNTRFFNNAFPQEDAAAQQVDTRSKDIQAGSALFGDMEGLFRLPTNLRAPQVDSFIGEVEQSIGSPVATNFKEFLKRATPEQGQDFINKARFQGIGASDFTQLAGNPAQVRAVLTQQMGMPTPTQENIQSNDISRTIESLTAQDEILRNRLSRVSGLVGQAPTKTARETLIKFSEIWANQSKVIQDRIKQLEAPFTLPPAAGRFSGPGQLIAQQPTAPPQTKFQPIQLEGGEIGTFEQGTGRITPTGMTGTVGKGQTISINTGAPAQTLQAQTALEGAKEFGKTEAKRLDEITGARRDAATSVVDLTDQALVDLARVNTGSLAEMAKFFSNVAVSFGATAPGVVEKASSLRNLSSTYSKLIVSSLGGKLGAQISNEDVKLMTEQVAKLTDANEVATTLLQQTRAIARKSVLASDVATNELNRSGDVRLATQQANRILGARLTGISKSGKQRYFPDFMEEILKTNPDASIVDIVDSWKSTYGNR